MVSIIERGMLPAQREYTTKCRTCGTTFSFIAREAKEHWDPRDGSYFSITCPLPGCETTVTVNSKN